MKIKFFLLTLLVFLSFTGINTVFAYDTSNEANSISERFSINHEYSTSNILVMLTKEESLLNRQYSPDDFKGINIKSVFDLTAPIDDFKTSSALSLNKNKEFRRILSLQLDNKPNQRTLGSYEEKNRIIDYILYLETLSFVDIAGPNYIHEGTNVPNDARYSDQWYLSNVGVPEAWKITHGNQEIRIGVMDTGIDGTHQDLKNRINNGLHAVFRNGVIKSRPTIPTDNGVRSSHGTHVAGIIGAQGNNSLGISGVTWNSTLVSLDISENDLWFVDNVIAATNYARLNGINILNYSGRVRSRQGVINVNDPIFEQAISQFPGLFVVGAGNNYSNNDNSATFPANYANTLDNVISVGALNRNNDKADFSNYGTSVSIYAPGVGILSTVRGNYYESWDGTSMAAPIVSGTAALILSVRPDLSGDSLKSLILNNSDWISINTQTGQRSVRKLNVARILAKSVYDLTFQGNNELIFNGSNIPIGGTFTIPETLFGRTVVGISNNAFENITTVSEFVVPHTVKTIGRFAFNNIGNASIHFTGRADIKNGNGQFFDQYWNPQGRPVRFGTNPNSTPCTHSNHTITNNIIICNDCHHRTVSTWFKPTLNATTNILTNNNSTIVDVFIKYRKTPNSPFTLVQNPIITNLLPNGTFSIPSEYLIGGEAEVQFKQPGQTPSSLWTKVFNTNIVPVTPTFIGNRSIRNDSSMPVKMRIYYIDTSSGSSDGSDTTYILKQNGFDIILQSGQTYRIPNHYFDYWYGFSIRFETTNGEYSSNYLDFGFNGGWIIPFSTIKREESYI